MQQAQVDQFIEYATTSLAAPLNAWTYPIHGLAKYNHQLVEQAMKDVPAALQYLEAHLATRTFLVGECVTGADIACALALLDGAKTVLDTRLPTGWYDCGLVGIRRQVPRALPQRIPLVHDLCKPAPVRSSDWRDCALH